MQKFLFNITKFTIALLCAMLLLVIVTSYIGKMFFDFNIPKEKNVLVLGNSHPECAIDDNALSNVFNLAQSGSAYFYDYLKLREIRHQNSHIDTLILGYTYGDLAKEMDVWFSGEDRLKSKIKNYLILFNIEDYYSLLNSNPINVIINTPQTIFTNIQTSFKGYSYLGGYNYLERDKLKEAKQRLKTKKKPISYSENSKYQSEYLLKINAFCKENNITLILLNTPLHPLEVEYQKGLISNYNKFASEKLPEAILVNHADFKLSESNFADLDHLNHKGAQIYTEFLKKKGFK